MPGIGVFFARVDHGFEIGQRFANFGDIADRSVQLW